MNSTPTSEQYSSSLHKHELKLRLLLTNVCNLNCEFCLNDFQDKPCTTSDILFLDYDIALNTIAEYTNVCKDKQLPIQIYLSGGEPLLHPRICDILNYVYENIPEAKLVLCTNGLLLPMMITDWLNNIQHGTVQLPHLLNKIEFHISVHSNLYIQPIRNVLFALYRYVFTNLDLNIHATISFVFKQNSIDLYGMNMIDYSTMRDVFVELPDRIKLKYKAWMNMHLLDNETYVSKFEKLKQMYPELVYRKASPLENRGQMCDDCNDHCVTLKALWVFPNGTACPCPNLKYTVHNLLTSKQDELSNIVNDSIEQHLTFTDNN